MAFSAKSGSFLTPSPAGVLSITGLGFQPKIVIFWGGQKDDPQGDADDAIGLFGVGISSSSRWASSTYRRDNVASTDDKPTFDTTKCILSQKATGTTRLSADFTSQDADGFTVTFVTVDSVQRRIFYLALGGSSLNAACGSFTTNTSTGNQSVSGVGFTPAGIILYSGAASGTAHDAIGAAVSSSSRWTSHNFGANGVTPSNERSVQFTSKCLARWGSTAAQYEADLVSMDADGFTINSTANDGVARATGYIALSGINIALGTFNQPAAGNTVISGLSFVPKVFLFQSAGFVANASSNDLNARKMLGVATRDDSQNIGSCYVANHNVNPSQAATRTSESKCIEIFETSAGTPVTLKGEASISTWSNSGGTLQWSTNDSTARQILYMALGESGDQPAKRLPIMGIG